ncbi:MAG: hypothetical protein Q7S52_03440 [bacterium]|nr:hypothetical protein [bacterium]
MITYRTQKDGLQLVLWSTRWKPTNFFKVADKYKVETENTRWNLEESIPKVPPCIFPPCICWQPLAGFLLVRVACIGSALAILPNIAFAALSPLAQGLGNPAPGAGSTLQDFVYLLIEIIQWVALPVLALSIIYAGFTLVSAGGDEKKIASGKLWLVSSLIGATIVLGARVIANIVFGTAQLLN